MAGNAGRNAVDDHSEEDESQDEISWREGEVGFLLKRTIAPSVSNRNPGGTIVCLVVLCYALLAAPAEGYRHYPDHTWPLTRITVHDGFRNALHSRALRRAVTAWNRQRLAIRFVFTTAAATAVVNAKPSPRRTGFQCHAEAQVEVRRDKRPVHAIVVLPPDCPRSALAQTLAHELGHVLGLDHEPRRCAIMNPTGIVTRTRVYPFRCRRSQAASIERKLVLGDDAAGARALYTRPRPLGSVTFARLPTDETRVTWRTPNDARADRVVITSSLNAACTDPRIAAPAASVLARRGQVQSAVVSGSGGLGRHCITVMLVTSHFWPALKPGQTTAVVGPRLAPSLVRPAFYNPASPPSPGTIFTVRANVANRGSATLTYAYDFGDPTGQDNTFTSTFDEGDHTYAKGGRYTITVTATDAATGLSGSGQATAVVASSPTQF